MKIFRRLFCAALVAVLLCASAMPAFAADKLTFYARSTSGEDWSWGSFSIEGYKAGAKVTGVKSDNKKVATVNCINYYNNEYHYLEDDRTEKYNEASVELRLMKPGTAKVSYSMGGKKYTQSVQVLKYVNPLKTLKLTGISSSKNLKSDFAKGSGASTTLSKNAKAGYLQVTAASGWKIRSMEWEDETNRKYYQISSWSKPFSSGKMKIPGMTKGKTYYVWITLINSKTGGEISLDYYIH